jgi:hypothetical protein
MMFLNMSASLLSAWLAAVLAEHLGHPFESLLALRLEQLRSPGAPLVAPP